MLTRTRNFNREELVQTLFEENGDALFLFDPDSELLIDVNPAAQRLSGFTRQEFLRMTVSYFFRSETPGRLNQLRQAFRKTGVFHSQEDFLLRTTDDGVWVPLNITLTRLHVRPKVLGLITARDIREQRETYARLSTMEAELRRVLASVSSSEARYRALTENLEQCIFLKDTDLRFIAANRRFCAGLGLSESELIGKADTDLYPAELADKYQADDRRVLGQGMRLEIEEENLAGGKRRAVRVVKTPMKDDNGRIVGVLGIFWDVTEQRALEAQLRQAQKMEAVGQLAGGLAHDFNNLLTVILGNVELLRNTLSVDESSGRLLDETQKAVLRAAELTSKMLGFSRRTALRLEPVTLNTLVQETIGLLRRTIDPRVHLVTGCAPDLWQVQADAGQINQVLMNLCLNARDAIPDGGRLRLETANVIFDAEAVRAHLDARAGEFVRLRVEDTGTGIAPDVLPRIFEPFFTTKEPGKGTGLGLAMVFGIVKQHRGWVDCTSTLGQGTRFDVYLPRSSGLPVPDASPQAAKGQEMSHSCDETILLVDDEPMIRNLGRAVLQTRGYRVHLAEDGQEAVELYRRQREHIDLVILDLMMPRLSGHDAFHQLRHLDPKVRVLFASGYSGDIMTTPQGAGVAGFLAKPYHPEELARVVRAALDRTI